VKRTTFQPISYESWSHNGVMFHKLCSKVYEFVTKN